MNHSLNIQQHHIGYWYSTFELEKVEEQRCYLVKLGQNKMVCILILSLIQIIQIIIIIIFIYFLNPFCTILITD